MITLEQVSCRLGSRTVLDDVSLQVEGGQVLALVGPNGAGKSTLLAVMSGDIPATQGRVELDRRPITSWNARELAQRRALLMQHNDVAFAFTSREIVEMGRAPWPPDPARDDELVAEAMARLDVTHLADRPFRSLSGGERARVSLARVLAQDAPIVLLDEPTAALDLRHQEEVMILARSLAAQDRAVVVVLHDLSLAAAYADRIAVVSNGRLHSLGAPQVVLSPEPVEEVYGLAVHALVTPEGHSLISPRRAHAGARNTAPTNTASTSGAKPTASRTPHPPSRSSR